MTLTRPPRRFIPRLADAIPATNPTEATASATRLEEGHPGGGRSGSLASTSPFHEENETIPMRNYDQS